MPDRIASDHPSIESTRVRVTRHGGRGRRIDVPAGILPEETVVRIVLDERTRFGRTVAPPTGDGRWVTGVYSSPKQARNPGNADNLLELWLDDHGTRTGGSLLLDTVEAGYAYGLREPGTRIVYQSVDRPADSLAAIARSLETNEE